MTRLYFYALVLIVFAQKTHATVAARGDYLIEVAGCVACHTGPQIDAKKLAGGKPIETPFGRLFSSNISPSSDGIGDWSLAQFERALRHGEGPQGQYYFPAFPFNSYRGLADDDVRAIYLSLRQQAPVAQKNRESELIFPFNQRRLIALWRQLHFEPPPALAAAPVAPSADYDRYITESIAHCSECHTPRDALGGLRTRFKFLGARLPSGHRAPNLRPSRRALAAWGEEDIAEYLATGRSDYTRKARDEMKEFIDCCTSRLSDEDRLAIARYLLRLPSKEPPLKRGPRSRNR